MSFFREIRAEIKGVQSRAFGIVLTRNIVAFLPVLFADSGKDAHVCLDVLTVGVVWFQRYNRLSVTIQMITIFSQAKFSKLNGFFVWISLKASLSTRPITNLDEELSAKQLLEIFVQVFRRDGACLAYDASDGIFSQSGLKRFYVR